MQIKIKPQISSYVDSQLSAPAFEVFTPDVDIFYIKHLSLDTTDTPILSMCKVNILQSVKHVFQIGNNARIGVYK